MGTENHKDKSTFVVALLAALLAFTAFKEELSDITILLGTYQINFLNLLIVFFILLASAAYVYALDYSRQGTRHQNFLLFRWILPFANFLYNAALIYPIIITLILIVNYLISLIKITYLPTEIISIFTSIISVIIGAIGAIVSSKSMTKRNRLQLSEKLEERAQKQLRKAKRLYENEFYSECILELFKVLSLNISGQLEVKGISTKNFSPLLIISLAKKEKIISEESLDNLELAREMRNKVAHADTSFSKSAADFIFKAVKNTLYELEKNNLK